LNKLIVKKAAVLGAGVMGAQIAAHLANANVPVVLFDLPAKAGDKNGVVLKALDGLKKLDPAPLASKGKLKFIDAANYEEHLPLLAECDLVIEAIAERMDWKNDLYAKIGPFLSSTAIVASNTSGLSMNALAQGLPEAVRPRFCGIHFFNPPRYMHLVEIIGTQSTDAGTLDALETWLVSRLGKGVIRALDTPNFVANRIGVFSILAVMHHTQAFGLGFDTVDALTGPKIGRPKSATYRTADVVGLDTLAHVVKTMQNTLPDDPWHAHFTNPAWLQALIAQGALGQKTRCGIFRKQGKEIQVLDLAAQDYRTSAGEIAEDVAVILKIKSPAEKFAALRASSHPQAQFLWAIFRDIFHYAAVQLEHVADNARDLDFAMRWGFGQKLGPFETWQAAGWHQVAAWVKEDIDAGKALCAAPLPAWVLDGRHGVHGADGSWSPARKANVARSTLPVYLRQRFRAPVLGEDSVSGTTAGITVFEDESVRIWHEDDGVLILSLKTKMHVIGAGVIAGLSKAIAEAEQHYKGLVIWGADAAEGGAFSAGADLQSMLPLFMSGGVKAIEPEVVKLQQALQAMKYANVPVVAAVAGLALGGGCELMLHAAKRVASIESYIGLVEVGVGLIPSGGGLKEAALRAAADAKGNDLLQFLKVYFTNAAMASVSKSALEARQMGYLKPDDVIVFNAYELLHVAKVEARAMFDAGYRPPLQKLVPVAGRYAIGTIMMQLVNMRDGGFISAHDFKLAQMIASIVSGGEVDQGSLVSEQWLLDLERKAFMELLNHPKTQERIMGMMQTGKPVRN
jgi:3-hydroxyacyl-CoA dehydrogenase